MIDKPELYKKQPLNLLAKRIDEVDLGRKAPQSVDMEKAVLAAIIIDKDGIDVATEILKPESFYLPSHQKIFEAAIKIADRLEPIDLSIIGEQLSRDGSLELAGGVQYLIELTNTVVSSANLEFHCRIVAQKYIQRELIRLSHETIKDAYTPTKDVFDVIDRIENQVSGLFSDSVIDPRDGVELFDECLEYVAELKANPKDGMHGLNTGISELNEITGGWRNGDLIILAGRTSMGKTVAALNQLVANNGVSAFFSLEMPSQQIMFRLMSSQSKIHYSSIERGIMSDADFNKLISSRSVFERIIIDDSHSMTLNTLKRKIRKIKRTNDLKLVVIDYLQLLMSNEKRGNREQEIAQISKGLKIIAKEMDIPVIALAQLSRAVETRTDKRPMLSDLREGGSIEMDADVVMFAYRAEYYDKEAKDEEGNSLKGIIEFIVAKNRNGATGVAKARFTGEIMKIDDFKNEVISLIPPASNYKAITSTPEFEKSFLGDEDAF